MAGSGVSGKQYQRHRLRITWRKGLSFCPTVWGERRVTLTWSRGRPPVLGLGTSKNKERRTVGEDLLPLNGTDQGSPTYGVVQPPWSFWSKIVSLKLRSYLRKEK